MKTEALLREKLLREKAAARRQPDPPPSAIDNSLDWELCEMVDDFDVRTPHAGGAVIGTGPTRRIALENTIDRLRQTIAELTKELAKIT